MRNVLFVKDAITDFEYWSQNDLKTMKKTLTLIVAVSKNPFDGIGKPALLKGDLNGYWSRRINLEHRLVYAINSEKIIIISCRSHYNF